MDQAVVEVSTTSNSPTLDDRACEELAEKALEVAKKRGQHVGLELLREVILQLLRSHANGHTSAVDTVVEGKADEGDIVPSIVVAALLVDGSVQDTSTAQYVRDSVDLWGHSGASGPELPEVFVGMCVCVCVCVCVVLAMCIGVSCMPCVCMCVHMCVCVLCVSDQ